MKKILVLAAICAPFAFFFSCKHDPVLPEHQVSFATEVHPIIAAGCQHNGCHDTIPTETFALTTYDDIIQHGEIKPGKPHDSKLYEVITVATGEDKMPRAPYPPLTDQQIQLIYIWIAQGAQNN